MYRGKRLFDLACALLIGPIWIVAMVVLVGIVRVRLGTPVFFRQTRIGMGDRPFTLIKFRTMTDERDGSGNLLPDDRRLTAFGRFLRSTSLDELPELLNVLRGEMSFVGPRPLLPQYLERYSVRHRRRHAVRPGLTGLAQVEGRNALRWSDRFELDLDYIDNASLARDCRILMKTIAVVLRRQDVNAPGAATMREFTGYVDDR